MRSLLIIASLSLIMVSCSSIETEYETILEDYSNDLEINEIFKQAKKNNALTILWFSDIHGDSKRLERIVSFHKLFSSFFYDILHSGDNVPREYSEGLSFWDSITGTEAILNTIGNHDSAVIIDGNYYWKEKTGLDCYNQYIAPYVENWSNVVFPVDAAETGKCYYYKDYEDQRVRLIVLDCMVMRNTDSNYDPSQIMWFESVLTDAIAKDLSVLLCSHCPPKSIPIDCSFTSNMFDSDGLFGGTYGGDAVFVNAVDYFIESGGEFISWISGDLHKDYIGYVKASRCIQPILVTACALCSPTASLTMKRVENTSSEDAFNILVIDTIRKNVMIKRVGSTIDNDLKSHDIIRYDYDTHTIIESR